MDVHHELDQLLGLARDKSAEGRRLLLDTVTDLFSEEGRVLNDREHALMTDILSKLLQDVEMRVRRELSERLARRKDAPLEIVKLLANDEIEVARPVLVTSSILRDIDLVEIVQHRTQQHQLSIAMRREVSEFVSEALVESGNADVIKALLDNPSARISEATLEYLVEESRRVDSYQEPLVRRSDLSPQLARRMCLWVGAALRSYILDNYDIDPTELDDLLEDVAVVSVDVLPQPPSLAEQQDDAASRLANRLAEAKRLTPDMLVQTLRQGEIPLFEAMFAQMTGLRRRLMGRLIYEPGGEGLVIACRALQIDKPAFTSIFLLSRKGRPGDQIVDPRELSRVISLFDRVKPEAAMQVLRRWQRNPEYLYAVRRVEESRLKQAAL
ncbi:DUF2336 domain-containing protein [Algihabitans albus]|uniref:DUF2336 domain-containing protein n=1 Tax=Algihabitans albus TaxID=2164067 RepID=UPI000E5D46E4|nr:DUF2336 domain-containing protein [Algihabitans albus]